MRRRLLLALALALVPVTVNAEGAIALGLPNDVARDGVAAGWAVGQPTGKAADLALQQCRTRPDLPQSTRDLCRVVQVFSGSCIAVAMDPDDGTPGFGWAVAAIKADAEATAMRGCRDTSGATRQAFCKLGVSACDRR
ncbi:MAG: DUF4189 domain-containing protein [Alphaproteobacteria bacterium]|nr:DUF4189 domain-containing protein [Alphaproteobacteria bacterium]